VTLEATQDDLIARLVPFLVQRGYEPGERVPSERELADRFSVSRGQVREALAYLEALRLVERRAKSGIYMSNQRPSLEALALLTEFGLQLQPEDVRQSVEMRRIFELAAIKLAAERATDENFARLDAIMAATAERVAAGEGIESEDIDFHLEIVRATTNDIFVRMVGVFYLMSAKRRAIYFRDPARCAASLKEHERILEALKSRNTALCEILMDDHLQGVDSYWRDLMAKGLDDPPDSDGPP
jgi:GntR family transcriptional regulator, transcriptional repressor for pyruvate dehydrogenase complex